MQVMQLIAEGGWIMYPIVALALLFVLGTIPVVVAGLVTKKRVVLFAAVLFGGACLMLLLGLVGEQLGISTVEEVLKAVNADDAEKLRAMGHAEARAPLIFAAWSALLPLAGAGLLAGHAPKLGGDGGLGSWGPALALAVGASLLCLGLAGREMAMSSVDRATAVIDAPADRAMIAQAGEAEARQWLWCMLAGMVAMGVGAAGAFAPRRET